MVVDIKCGIPPANILHMQHLVNDSESINNSSTCHYKYT